MAVSLILEQLFIFIYLLFPWFCFCLFIFKIFFSEHGVSCISGWPHEAKSDFELLTLQPFPPKCCWTVGVCSHAQLLWCEGPNPVILECQTSILLTEPHPSGNLTLPLPLTGCVTWKESHLVIWEMSVIVIIPAHILRIECRHLS